MTEVLPCDAGRDAVHTQDAQGAAEWLRRAPDEAKKARGTGRGSGRRGGGSSRPSAFPVAFLPRLGCAWHWPLVVNIGKSTITGDHQ